MAQIDTSIPPRAFPVLKQEMTQAAETGRFAADVRGTVDHGIMAAHQSPGAAFANAPAERKLQTILQASDPRAAARSLVRQAANDETGQAVHGLKAAALDHLIGKASRDGGKVHVCWKMLEWPLLLQRVASSRNNAPKVKAQRALRDRAA